MARPLRIEYPGAVYHITSRGNARQDVYLSDDDRSFFLHLFKSILQRYHWLCYGYCLMNNHYHLLVETEDANLSLGMRQLNGVYTQRFNKRHDRVGHLFQGRYKAILVEKESYLLELNRYIALNPARAGLVAGPQDWAWSGYKELSGEKTKIKIVSCGWILSQFGQTKIKAQQEYRKFVFAGLDKESLWKELKGGIILGGEKLTQEAKEYLELKNTDKEFIRCQRYAGRPSLDSLFEAISQKKDRNKKIYHAHQSHGYTLAEISRHLRIHYSVASRAFKEQANAKNKT